MRKQTTYLIVFYSLLAGVLLATELFFRIFIPPSSTLSVYAKNKFEFNTRTSYGQQIFDGDPVLGWKLIPNLRQVTWDFTVVSTNDQGYRYHKHIDNKKDGAIRVISLGDSVTFGYRVPLVYPIGAKPDMSHRPYPKLLEDFLKKNNPGQQIEVIPMAVPGYSSFQGLQWFRQDGLSLKPDLVTIMYGWNDTDTNTYPDVVSLRSSRLSSISRTIVSKSQVLIKLAGLFSARNNSNQPLLTSQSVRVSKDDYISNILAIAKLAISNGSKVVIIGQVYRDSTTNEIQANRVSEYRRALATAAKDNGIPYLQIDELTENSSPSNASLFGELVHPNYDGHKLIADGLLSLIKKESLLGNVTY